MDDHHLFIYLFIYFENYASAGLRSLQKITQINVR